MRDPLLTEIETTIVNSIEAFTQYRATRDDFSKPLKNLGLTSVQGMLLIGELEDTYSIDVQHDFLLGNDTLAAFSQRIYELAKG
jgi:acyl carrier protein